MDFYEPKTPGFNWSQLAGLVAAGLVLMLWFSVIAPKYFPSQQPRETQPEEVAAREETGGTVHEEEEPGLEEEPGGGVGDEEPAAVDKTGPEEEEPAPDEEEPALAPDIVVETEEIHAVLSARGACLKELSLLQYTFMPDDEEPLPLIGAIEVDKDDEAVLGFGLALSDAADFVHRNWHVKEHDIQESGTRVVMLTRKDGWEMEKEYSFPEEGFVFTVTTSIRNVSDKPSSAAYTMRTLQGILPDDEPNRYFSIEAVLAGRESPIEKLLQVKVNSAKAPTMDVGKLRLSSSINEWEALRNRYFAVLVAPMGQASAFYVTPAVPSRELLADAPRRFMLPNLCLYTKGSLGKIKPGEEKTIGFKVYAGPKRKDLLAAASVDEDDRDHDFDEIVVYGFIAMFDWLSGILLSVLNFFAMVIPNYGVAIILLTLVVKLVMHPMTRKSGISMHKMQLLAPQITAIKKKYANDKSPEGMKRMNTETMELYRKHGVSPLGGCLPMLLQLPMFFALFGTLRGAFELRQSGFLWIEDLTKADNLFDLPFVVPFFKWTSFNLLPVLYVVLILLQQKLQPKTNDPQQQQQRKMMMLMPVMFFFIFYTMPSGLVLYFAVSNLISITEQWLLRRSLDNDPAIAALKAGADGTAILATSVNEQPERQTSWDRQREREEKERKKREERRRKQQNRPS